jgi:hypothetical protein
VIDSLADGVDQSARTIAAAAALARDLRWMAWAVIGLGGSYLIARFIEVLTPRGRSKE